jgi:hypothetical protein
MQILAIGKCQVIVGDGISIGRPCCASSHCTEPLQNNRHRFCQTHYNQHSLCAVVNCHRPTVGTMKTCSLPAHKEMEELSEKRGKAAFTLTQRLRRAQAAYPTDATSISNNLEGDVQEHDEWFEINEGSVKIFNAPNHGSVGIIDEPEPKAAQGNRKIKAQFSRQRTHNEQTLVRPCGIIFARATMYNAEAVSNFLVWSFYY